MFLDIEGVLSAACAFVFACVLPYNHVEFVFLVDILYISDSDGHISYTFCLPSQRKQQELGDMMDLSSYLLRPIQRISKYSLLLQDMLSLAGSYRPKDMIQDTLVESSVCGPAVHVPELTRSERERERAEIQAAADLVRFQMRHGNDLLTMDAIQDCDVRY